MEKAHHIIICMGSSCFSRGNKRLVRMIQEFLKENKLEDSVLLKGAHCMGQCDLGPVMEIDGERIFSLTEENLIDTIRGRLNLSTY